MGRAVGGYCPDEERAVGLLLHGGDGQLGSPACLASRGKAHVGHHAGQQSAVAIRHADAHVVGVRQCIGLYAFLYERATGVLACRLHVDVGRRVGADASYLSFGHRHLHLHRAHVENGHHGLRGQGGLAGACLPAAHDASHGSHQPAVGHILLGHLELRTCLRHLALYLHPLHFGQ